MAAVGTLASAGDPAGLLAARPLLRPAVPSISKWPSKPPRPAFQGQADTAAETPAVVLAPSPLGRPADAIDRSSAATGTRARRNHQRGKARSRIRRQPQAIGAANRMKTPSPRPCRVKSAI